MMYQKCMLWENNTVLWRTQYEKRIFFNTLVRSTKLGENGTLAGEIYDGEGGTLNLWPVSPGRDLNEKFKNVYIRWFNMKFNVFTRNVRRKKNRTRNDIFVVHEWVLHFEFANLWPKFRFMLSTH